MYEIENTPSDYKLTFEDLIEIDEMKKWIEKISYSYKLIFGNLIEMDEMK